MPRVKSEQARDEKAGITDKGAKETICFQEGEAEAFRVRAFQGRRSESAIVWEVVRRLLGIED